MVAALPLLLSQRPPNLARRAGLGDRFHYFCGASRRRYLFSAVARDEMADFRSAVVILARRAPEGLLSAWSVAALDRFGRPIDSRRPWPPIMPIDSVVLVHLLASTEADRRDVVNDLTRVALPLAA